MQRKQEKNLKPTMRDNRRYLLVEKGKSRKEIEEAILEYIGILGWARAAPVFVKENIIAVNREELDKVRASFELAGIRVMRVSGTLKGLR
ncbi:hypothetical protein HYW76_01360 [Candidatus Pacearchaeota archaeon]|nr:hypothetical protein [Candidatus Pacearchaeota archaeon]